MAQTKDIFVFVEVRNHQVQEGSKQLLAKSRELVKQITVEAFEVVGVLLGQGVADLCDEVFAAGADKVILVEHDKLAHFSTQHYANVLSEVVDQFKPDSFLISATTIGRDVAPRVAARQNAGLTADATKIEVEENSTMLLVTRPAFGGNLFGTIICPNTRPQMATIRPNVFTELDTPYASRKEVVKYEYVVKEEDVVRLVSSREKESKGINIAKAEVILAAGRGLKDSFNLVVETAKKIGATPAASRALVDANIAPKDLQVGQTGTTVKPKIYIASGISGAVQHTAGMDKSELIIAINTDPHAAIFSIANVGYVADAKKVIPLLEGELQKLNPHK